MIYSEFQPLECVALGNIFPTDEYLYNLKFSDKWAKDFATITDKSILELNNIQQLLESRGVQVVRPHIYPMNTELGYAPSPLALRDCFSIYENKVLIANEAFKIQEHRVHAAQQLCTGMLCYNIPTYDLYSTCTIDKFNTEQLDRPYLHTANILRCGKDVFISGAYEITGNSAGMHYAIDWFNQHHPDVRVHIVDSAIDHLDGYIHMIRPGLALSVLSKNQLPDFFANWDIIECDEYDRREVYGNTYAHKYKKLNPIVAHQYATFLQANPEETFFIINGLSLDESTVMLPGFNSKVFDTLERKGVECISVDLSATSFFDCGLHCATNELTRTGDCENYR